MLRSGNKGFRSINNPPLIIITLPKNSKLTFRHGYRVPQAFPFHVQLGPYFMTGPRSGTSFSKPSVHCS